MSWYNPLSWLRPPTVAPLAVPPVPRNDPQFETTVELDPIVAPELQEATEVKVNARVDAAITLLILLDHELGDASLPDDLREISDRVHAKVPLAIRDNDTPTSRAEFALTIQRGALYLRAMKDWYDSP